MRIFTTVILFFLTQINVSFAEGIDDLDFFLGEWDITSKDIQPNGQYALSKAKSKAYRFLDGTSIMDEWRSLGPDGEVVFRGGSFRTYVPWAKKWQIVWFMANVTGYTNISANFKDGEIQMTGQGEDPSGQFLERAKYYEITDNGFKFTMDRSYDGGVTWISPFNEFEAVRLNIK